MLKTSKVTVEEVSSRLKQKTAKMTQKCKNHDFALKIESGVSVPTGYLL